LFTRIEKCFLTWIIQVGNCGSNLIFLWVWAKVEIQMGFFLFWVGIHKAKSNSCCIYEIGMRSRFWKILILALWQRNSIAKPIAFDIYRLSIGLQTYWIWLWIRTLGKEVAIQWYSVKTDFISILEIIG
jgi:hypothetical protein